MARRNKKFQHRNHAEHYHHLHGHNRPRFNDHSNFDSCSSDEESSPPMATNPFTRRSHSGNDYQRRNQLPKRTQFSPYRIQPQFDHKAFFRRSQRLKRILKQNLEHVLVEVEKWFPEEIIGPDDMDWQPEDEVVIPQMNNDVVYSYGLSYPSSVPPVRLASNAVGAEEDNRGNYTFRAPARSKFSMAFSQVRNEESGSRQNDKYAIKGFSETCGRRNAGAWDCGAWNTPRTTVGIPEINVLSAAPPLSPESDGIGVS